ncbi:MAG: ATP-binding protein [Euryarchaeota archaeon]|nr:ATP-binding protein [Euryarchaeota archaeon]MBU4221342.1 ATP-binding protein [Euryarchaeota archaeon]MBU4340413.1 ATP-binding protein [Euryarchaeota archaeon]MBU4454047.1 ATP-binding protein [Euryarchaeota archaeon]MCG2735288.1 ATP-binding protein [Candidatus Methanoperedenaceae archaeon]
MFINREPELSHLEEEYSKNTSRFVVLYGRRRIGKTALIEDNFLDFWFRFVLPNRSRIEMRDTLDLLDTAPKVSWGNAGRKEHFAFISKAGFTGKAVELARDNGVILFELKDMEKYFG